MGWRAAAGPAGRCGSLPIWRGRLTHKHKGCFLLPLGGLVDNNGFAGSGMPWATAQLAASCGWLLMRSDAGAAVRWHGAATTAHEQFHLSVKHSNGVKSYIRVTKSLSPGEGNDVARGAALGGRWCSIILCDLVHRAPWRRNPIAPQI